MRGYESKILLGGIGCDVPFILSEASRRGVPDEPDRCSVAMPFSPLRRFLLNRMCQFVVFYDMVALLPFPRELCGRDWAVSIQMWPGAGTPGCSIHQPQRGSRLNAWWYPPICG